MRYWTQVGTESIGWQDGKTARMMTECFEKIMTGGEFTSAAVAKSGLAKVIGDQTGISVEISVDDSPFPNAYVGIPDIDRNNPLINDWERKWFRNGDLSAIQKFVNGKFTGLIDRENSRVGGDLSKFTVPMFITRGLLASELFSAEEKAAVIGHECGHVFTYYERLIDLVSANYGALTAAERILNTGRGVDRIEILREYDKALGVNIPDKENVIKMEKGEAIYVHVVSETVKQRRNEEGDTIYSYRGFEFSSDQFATRHGFGRALVTALDKVNRSSYNSSYASWPVHIAIQVAKVALVSFIIVGSAIAMRVGNLFVTIVMLLAARPLNKSYDEPMARAQRIRREMITELKDNNLPKAKRQQVIQDLDIIDLTMKDVEDKRTVMEAIWAYLVPSGREATAKMEYQQMIERLANNDLFAQTAKLTDLGEA